MPANTIERDGRTWRQIGFTDVRPDMVAMVQTEWGRFKFGKVVRVTGESLPSATVWAYWKTDFESVNDTGERLRYYDATQNAKIYILDVDQIPAALTQPAPQQEAPQTQAQPAQQEPQKKEFLKMKVERCSTGVKIWLKSETLENFFKGNGDANTWMGKQIYRLPDTIINKICGYDLTEGEVRRTSIIGGPAFTHGNAVEFNLFRVKGLSEGVEVKYSGVYTNEEIEKFVKGFLKVAKAIYTKHIKPVTYECAIKLETLQY